MRKSRRWRPSREEVAQDAIRLIKVDYEVLPHLATVEQAMRPEAPLVFEKGNTREPTLQQDGDLEAGFKAAAHIVEGLYSTQVQTHTSLETHGGICEWNGENLTAWVSTQAVHATREGTARALNIPQTNVRVITDYMGGGFGSKLGGDVQVVICARLAKMANAPVKLMLDRKEEHLVTGNRPSAFAKIRAGVDANGKLLAIDAETWGTGGAGQGSNFPVPYQVYVFPSRRQRHTDVYINAGPQRAFRAPGHPQSCFVTEIVMDELADRLRLDPLELRLRNLPPEARERAVGALLQDGRGADRLEQASSDRRFRHGSDQARHGLRGQPVGAERQPTDRAPPVEIHPDGGVVMQERDAGHRHRHANARGDRDRRDDGPADRVGVARRSATPTIRGRQAAAAASRRRRSRRSSAWPADDALQQLFAKVAPALKVADPSTPRRRARTCSRRERSQNGHDVERSVQADRDRCQSTRRRRGRRACRPPVPAACSSPTSKWTSRTGVTRVKRIVCVQDCGMIVDKLTAESQCYGGIIMGLGFALFENRILDRNTAQMVNPNMEWYLVPGMSDIPQIDVTLVDQPTRGVIGLGEPPVISTAAAVGNAVANAIGARVRTLPLTPAAVLSALERERAGGTL